MAAPLEERFGLEHELRGCRLDATRYSNSGTGGRASQTEPQAVSPLPPGQSFGAEKQTPIDRRSGELVNTTSEALVRLGRGFPYPLCSRVVVDLGYCCEAEGERAQSSDTSGCSRPAVRLSEQAHQLAEQTLFGLSIRAAILLSLRALYTLPQHRNENISPVATAIQMS